MSSVNPILQSFTNDKGHPATGCPSRRQAESTVQVVLLTEHPLSFGLLAPRFFGRWGCAQVGAAS